MNVAIRSQMALLPSPIEDITMQVFGNVATAPERKESKTTGRGYYQFRICEAQRNVDNDPSWYTVRVMKDEDPLLDKGDFVKVTGKLKADFYIGRDGKPTGTLLIIAFEASKIAKPAALATAPAPAMKQEVPRKAPDITKAELQTKAPLPVRATELETDHGPQCLPEPARVTVAQEEADWSTLYN
jgi:hypothetical protein